MDLFQYREYKNYIIDKIYSYPNHGHGIKKQISEALSCQTSHFSRILNGNENISLEHGILLNRFFNHTPIESDFFILLIQYSRSGSHGLKNYFDGKIKEMVLQRHNLKDRFRFKDHLKKEEQAIYYSAWFYAAIHVVLGIEKYDSIESISTALKLPTSLTGDVLEFLLNAGLVKKKNQRYKVTERHVNLPKSSPLISKHHINWRLQAMKALDSLSKNNLHYTSVLTLSEDDFYKLKEVYIQSIGDMKDMLKTTKPAKLYNLNLDFYECTWLS